METNLSRLSRKTTFLHFLIGLLLLLGMGSLYVASTIKPTLAGEKQTQSLLPTAPETKPSSAENQAMQKEDSVSLKNYQEILEKERKLLDEQSERYYTRLEKLAYVILGALAIALASLIGFFAWLFGQTRAEVVSSLKTDLEEQVLATAKAELEQFRTDKLDEIKADYDKLKAELDQLKSFGQQRIVWLLNQEMAKPHGEIAALNAVGLQRVEPVAPKSESIAELDAMLADANLVIVSYDGGGESKKLLSNAAAAIKFKQPPVSLLIYTYGFYTPEGRPIQLQADELNYLKELASFAPANFPATLVSQAQSLILRGRTLGR